MRVFFAALFFCAVTLLFLDSCGITHAWLGWTAKIQFLPALFAANFAVVAALVLATLVFGRIYCSVICPLGVLQDIISNLSGRRKRNRFSYTPAKTPARIAFLAAFAILTALGAISVAALIAPYAAYGRIASNFLAPIWAFCNNALSFAADKLGSYAFYPTEVWFKGAGSLFLAAATLGVVGTLAWKNGRAYCNTVCPVGTILGLLAKYSLFKPAIETSKCISCGLCARNCKAKCIDSRNHKIDYSRCVDCFDCISSCRKSAISYSALHTRKSASSSAKNDTAKSPTRPKNAEKPAHPVPNARRGFFATALLVASSAFANAAEKTVDGGLTPIKKRKSPKREFPILPPGAQSAANFGEKCVACQLCVSACPSHVLAPSARLANFMQPEMNYERGYCAVDCVECSKVCPAGAIKPITAAEKSSIQIGRAIWHSERCIVNTDGMPCDNCFRQCPSGAIAMVLKDPKDAESKRIPVVDEARCIGCGACENLCPARPEAAICVEANTVHVSI